MTDNIIDNSALETLLPQAFKSAEGNHDFLALLINSDVYILGAGKDGGGDGHKTLAADTKIDIEQWIMHDDVPIIPVFTSVSELQKSIEHDDARYMALNAGQLFTMLNDIGVVINPMSDYAYRIDAGDMMPMLAHFLNHDHGAGDPDEVFLGHAQEELVAALKQALSGFFKGRKEVAYACLALMARASGDQSVLIGVSFGDNPQSQAVIDGVAQTAKPHMPEGFGLDLVILPEPPTTEGVEGYLQQNGDQFYTR